MFDFCYFANVLMMAYLWVFPDNCRLYHVCFAFTNGPLAFAILAWRNSLVFHSLDKTTSIFIHLTPNLVIWSLHWFPGSPNYATCAANHDTISFYEGTIFPLVVPYLMWQVLYYLKVEIFDKPYFKSDKEIMTSYKYTIGSGTGIMYQFCMIFGKKYSVFMFGVAQFVYTFFTLCLIKLFYENYWIHTVFLFLIITGATYNGAQFYIEVFSKRYQTDLIKMAQHYENLGKLLESA